MKKIILSVLMAITMLSANSIYAGTLKLEKSRLGSYTIIVNDKDKHITMLRTSVSDGYVTNDNMNKTLKEIKDVMCGNDVFASYIKNGYNLDIIYIFKNGLVIDTTITTCKR